MRFCRFITKICMILTLATAQNADAQDINMNEYFESIQGKWAGKGEVIAGKYKNTKFICNINGKTPETIGMDIDGDCRIGFISQKISAFVEKNHNLYRGEFLGGAEGNGLDIIGGVLKDEKFTAYLVRDNLGGTIEINGQKKDNMKIDIAIEYQEQLYPIIVLNMVRENKKKKRRALQ